MVGPYEDLRDCGIPLLHRAVDFVHKLGAVLSKGVLRCDNAKTIQCPHAMSVWGRLCHVKVIGRMLVNLIIESFGAVEVGTVHEGDISLQGLQLHPRVDFTIEVEVDLYSLEAVVVGHSTLVTLRDCLSRSSRDGSSAVELGVFCDGQRWRSLG